ncbi:MAG: D-2-hydroxyacid dehydrogenase [Waddliaceae bacterium]|nr:D-2-hydroxyacid dehydrogenase [Waddliaceae bacterium]
MSTVYCQTPIPGDSLRSLRQEFPHFQFFHPQEGESPDSSIDWSKVEILYGNRLSSEQFASAPLLHWIHSPTPTLDELCLEDIHDNGTVIVSNTKGENIIQVGEYVMGALLSFAKNLFEWKELASSSKSLWNSSLIENMWSIQNRILLQVGLGTIGHEVSRRAKQFGMRVWGVDETSSFHPYCEKNFQPQELHAIIPYADVLCISMPRGPHYTPQFGIEELSLLKDDSILIIVGASRIIRESDLVKVVLNKKLRGIIIDSFNESPLPKSSPLWSLPRTLITPEIATYPELEKQLALKIFRHNLRHFAHTTYTQMNNLVY